LPFYTVLYGLIRKQKINKLLIIRCFNTYIDILDKAHNPKVTGSSPVPATIITFCFSEGYFYFKPISSIVLNPIFN